MAEQPTIDVARRAAREARARQDWPDLLVHARGMLEQHPGEADGYVLAATALRRLRRRAEMQALLTLALARFPDHARLLALASPQARSADQQADAKDADTPESLRDNVQRASAQKDWPALETACRRLRASAADEPLGYQMGARALRGQKRMRQADALSLDGVTRFPDHPGMLVERAVILQRRKLLEAAAECYVKLRALQPQASMPYARGANILVLLGRFDEAEAMLQAGLDRFPGDLELLVQRAVAATRRQDFGLARARWEEVRVIAPDDRRLASFLGNMAVAEQLLAIPDDGVADIDEAADTLTEPADAAVLKQFEALGGNCEFGLVQRAAGIEPLGLLRFAGITAEELTGLLRSGLEGVGSAAQTELSLNNHQEYMLEDKRFFRTHTFINFGETDSAALLDKLLKRTVFLRGKLLAELRKGAKLFLFRPADGVISDAMIADLHAAFRALSPGTLVCVRNAPEAEPRVRVAERGPGLLVGEMPGHTSKLSLEFVQAQRYGHWIELCRAAVAARAAAKAD